MKSKASRISSSSGMSFVSIAHLLFAFISWIKSSDDIIDVWHGKTSSSILSFHGINYSIFICWGLNQHCSKKDITLGYLLFNTKLRDLSIILERHKSGKPFSISIISSKLFGLCWSTASFRAVSSLMSGFKICRASFYSCGNKSLLSDSLWMPSIISQITSGRDAKQWNKELPLKQILKFCNSVDFSMISADSPLLLIFYHNWISILLSWQ